MSKLIMCKGLTASGKSTWAREMVKTSDSGYESTTTRIVVITNRRRGNG